MKRLFKNCLVIILASIFVQASAQDDKKIDKLNKLDKLDKADTKEKKRFEFYRERSISKSYPATGNALSIDNRFGEVKITTWDKNEIKIDIHIDASSTDKEMADKTFEGIDVKDVQNAKEIKFETIIKSQEIHCKNCSNSMNIDYDIHMPNNNRLNIDNSFGAINMQDYAGPLNIKSSYGSFIAGTLAHPEKIVVEFGKTNLDEINNTDLTFRYSSINIKSLSGSNKMKMDFCGYSRIGLDNDLTSLTVNETYSTLHLMPASNLSASYDINTSYGSLTDKSNADIKRVDTPERYGPDLNHHYQGKAGNGNGKIEIKSSFGSILIGGTEADLNNTNKNKNKRVI